jgi:hypothetical protein
MTSVFNVLLAHRAEVSLKYLGWRLPFPSGQHTQIGRQLIEGWFEFGRQRLAKDLAVLGLGRTLVPRSRALQPDNEVIVKVAHM